jgi:hypothetical protein
LSEDNLNAPVGAEAPTIYVAVHHGQNYPANQPIHEKIVFDLL